MSERRQAQMVEVANVDDGRDRRRQSLARRLEDGYHRIDQAISTGADVAAWESFWIDLLHEYEAVCDELREAA